MATHPVLHEAYDSLRFGRVLFIEAAPGDLPSTPCRYCRLLQPGAVTAARGHFSNPDSCAKAILETLGSGEAPERIAFGGPGDPLRELGIASVMRRVRMSSHLGAILFSDGALLTDRDVRRDAAEAETVVAALPAVGRAGLAPFGAESIARGNAFDRHVAALASLRRETSVQIVLEMAVRAGENDVPESIEAWRRALETIRPHRAVVLPAGSSAGPEAKIAADRVRSALGRATMSANVDATPVDRRCYCGEAA